MRGRKKISFLPGSDLEVDTIGKLFESAHWQVKVWKNYEANEQNLFNATGPGKISPYFLHIATHGFYFPEIKQRHRPVFFDIDPYFKISANPLLRSGLLLAGAEHAWETGKPIRDGFPDGILTAYEVGLLNLQNTELVVLSACNSALGDIATKEGVFGLRRAFKIAGAHYLIMALWKIPDRATQELMTLFYDHHLVNQVPVPLAFRCAQKEMQAKYPNPYYWGAWVLVE